MIKYVGSTTGAHIWEIDGIQLTLGFNKKVEPTKYHQSIQEMKDYLITCAYTKTSATPRRFFEYFGCIPFFRIGMEAFRVPFLDMCTFYAREYIRKSYVEKSGTFIKTPSFGHVLADMVQCSPNDGLTSFGMLSTYEKNYRDVLSSLMQKELDTFCGEMIAIELSEGRNLKEIADKVGIHRTAKCCMDFVPGLTETTIRAIAAAFTERRQIVTLYGVQTALWGDRKGHGYTARLCDQRFVSLIEEIVQDEVLCQEKLFIAENYLETDTRKDIWTLYRMHGGNLSLFRADFTVIRSPSLRTEVKYCMAHRLKQSSYTNFVSTVSHALNILVQQRPSIKYVADVTDADVRALYICMQSEYVTPYGNKLSVTTIGNVIMYCSYLCEYLMGDRRNGALKSPKPHYNPFKKFKFHNLDDYKVNTAIIPECVAEKIDQHLGELNETNRLLYRIFSYTGMRMKEALFLQADCIEPSRYENLSQIKYTPYKVLMDRRRSGLEDTHRVLIPQTLAKEILAYAHTTQDYRARSGLQFIFLNDKYHGKINMISMGSFMDAINRLIKAHNICNEDGQLWHFTTRQSRKTIAVTLIENGVTTSEVAYWLGHLTSTTSARYYAEVRKMKLAQLNSAFFKKQFDLLLSKQQLANFTEEERKLLYVDFRLEQRRVELGFCLLQPSEGGCTIRNSMHNCVNCQHLCTGKKYLPYWQQLLEEQMTYQKELLLSYEKAGIQDFEDFKEYRRIKFLMGCYQNVVVAIQNGGTGK